MLSKENRRQSQQKGDVITRIYCDNVNNKTKEAETMIKDTYTFWFTGICPKNNTYKGIVG